MFLKKTRSKNHTYLSIVETYREEEQVKHRTLAMLGRLDQLQANKQLERLVDGIERMCAERKHLKREDFEEIDRLNWGANKVYRALWDSFDLDSVLQKIKASKRLKYNLSETTFIEVVSRLLSPCSKLKLYEAQSKLIGIQPAKLHELYRVLDVLADAQETIEQHVFEKSKDLFNYKVDVVFYDVTTLYFESVDADTLRDFGYSKDCKFGEVQVVLGLLITPNGMPIGFNVFKGNTFEGKTLKDALDKLKTRFSINRVIIVADRGMSSKINLKQIKESGFDYLVGSRLKTFSNSMKNQVLDKSLYQPLFKKDDYEVLASSFDFKNVVTYQEADGSKRKQTLNEKVYCTWDSKRATKDAKDRERLVEKAREIVESGGPLESKRGAKRYIDSKTTTGAISLCEEKIKADAEWDGFYGIQSSRTDLSIQEVTDAYRGLWKIEESFRILKTTLQARPVFHWTENRIKGHLVVCFIAFLLERSLELMLMEANIEHSPEKIRSAVSAMQLSVVKVAEEQNMHLMAKLEGLSVDLLNLLKIKIPKGLVLPE